MVLIVENVLFPSMGSKLRKNPPRLSILLKENHEDD